MGDTILYINNGLALDHYPRPGALMQSTMVRAHPEDAYSKAPERYLGCMYWKTHTQAGSHSCAVRKTRTKGA